MITQSRLPYLLFRCFRPPSRIGVPTRPTRSYTSFGNSSLRTPEQNPNLESLSSIASLSQQGIPIPSFNEYTLSTPGRPSESIAMLPTVRHFQNRWQNTHTEDYHRVPDLMYRLKNWPSSSADSGMMTLEYCTVLILLSICSQTTS